MGLLGLPLVSAAYRGSITRTISPGALVNLSRASEALNSQSADLDSAQASLTRLGDNLQMVSDLLLARETDQLVASEPDQSTVASHLAKSMIAGDDETLHIPRGLFVILDRLLTLNLEQVPVDHPLRGVITDNITKVQAIFDTFVNSVAEPAKLKAKFLRILSSAKATEIAELLKLNAN